MRVDRPRVRMVPVWSAAVRISHALVAAIVLFNLFNETGPLHRYMGYTAAALVLLRLAWGLTRPRTDTAHLGLPSWPAWKRHALDLFQARRSGRVQRSLGHNPAGLCMALLIWTLVLALGLSGWVSQLDAFWGEDGPVDLHTTLARVLQVCIVLHWLGVLLMSLLQRENLVAAMVSGRKRASDEAVDPP